VALRLTALEERIKRLKFVGARQIGKGRSRLRHYMKIPGPGIIAGAADDDPLRPWLSGLYVAGQRRGRGVGTKPVEAGLLRR
jgi:hypothetical protein